MTAVHGHLSFRDWAVMVFGPEGGDRLAHNYSEALGRALDEAILTGTTTTTPVQENEMKMDRILEVSETVDDALTTPQYDGLGDAEKLGLIVGAAYGRALAERDEARAALAKATETLEYAVANWPETSWAQDSHHKTHVVQVIETLKAVDSEQTPAQED